MTSANIPNFRGRIFQVIEALDYGDAVSNQVLAIDRMLSAAGFKTAIHCKWFFESMAKFCLPLDALKPEEGDLVLLHFAGYSEFALPYIEDLYCTKICVYHNITPHTFFQPGTDIHAFCLKGREQLPRVVAGFHHFWGDSQYNLDELIECGAPVERCSVVPILVAEEVSTAPSNKVREAGRWMFLGRVAANKGQVNLVKLFANVRSRRPELAQRLFIVGSVHDSDPYGRSLREAISDLGLEDSVTVTGKVGDEKVAEYLAQSSIYVSLSEHEGFGVPLIEAAHHGLPVVALRNTAVGETLGESTALAHSIEEVAAAVQAILSDESRYEAVRREQQSNARRFGFAAVQARLVAALTKALPAPDLFKNISVVICTYNRSALLERCLDYLQYQTNQNFEVVVVNGPSSDDTDLVLERHATRIKVGRNPEANLSKSRNIGIELSSGDLIAFIDDDALPFDDWVDTLLREFNQRPTTLAALGGPVYLAGTLDFQSQDIGINKLAESKVNIDSFEIGRKGWLRSLLGTNTCFRADILRGVSGFDEQFDYFLDESELCFRLQQQGWLVGYCPDLYLRHEFAQSSNRGGAYKYNWFSICKNTAYFIAAYSGLKGRELRAYVERRIEDERVKPLDAAVGAGELTAQERDLHLARMREGAEQGLADSALFPRRRSLRQLQAEFLPFAPAAHGPLVGRDLRPLHVCFVTKEFPPFSGTGGIGTLYYHLAAELLQMGHHVSVVTPGAGDGVYRRGRFQVRHVAPHTVCTDGSDTPGFALNLNWSMRALAMVATVHEERRVDVVDSALWDAEALSLAMLPANQRPALVVRLVTPFATAAKFNGWKVGEREHALFMRAERTLLDAADAVLPISRAIARTVENEHTVRENPRWHPAPCGIAYWPSFESRRDYTELTQVNGKPFDLPADAKVVLFIGRLERRKGIDVLLKAARKFLAANASAWLVVAGRETEDWTQRIVDEVGALMARRVRFLGEVDTPTREKLLHAAYCVAFPSRYESFGLVPLEAFVHGTPVIAAASGAIPEVVVDGRCGLLYESEDIDALAGCVSRLLQDAALHARLVSGAFERIREFSSRRSGLQSVEIYMNLLAGDRTAATQHQRQV